MKMLNDHSVSINFKYYDNKDFNKLNINKTQHKSDERPQQAI